MGLVLGFGLWGSCLQSPRKVDSQEAYFDLKSYFEKKQNLFERKKIHLIKTLYFEGKQEKIEVSNPEWDREMVFFRESDINKPAWSGKFRKENLMGNLIYQGLDTDKVNIRRVIFYHYNSRDSSFDSLRIEKKESNLLSRLNSVLVYKPDSAYSLVYNQNIRFYKGTHYTLTAQLKP